MSDVTKRLISMFYVPLNDFHNMFTYDTMKYRNISFEFFNFRVIDKIHKIKKKKQFDENIEKSQVSKANNNIQIAQFREHGSAEICFERINILCSMHCTIPKYLHEHYIVY